MSMKKTVVSMGLSRASNKMVRLEIEDELSRQGIVSVEFSLEELGLLVTGLYGVKGVAKVGESGNIGKRAVTKTVTCEKSKELSKEHQLKLVLEDFKQYEQLGWVLKDDGLRSQQNVGKHTYIIRSYEDVGDITIKDIEKYY